MHNSCCILSQRAHFFAAWIAIMDDIATGHVPSSISSQVGGTSGSWHLLLEVWHFWDIHLHRHLLAASGKQQTPITSLIICKLYHRNYLHFRSIIAISEPLIAIWHLDFCFLFPDVSGSVITLKSILSETWQHILKRHGRLYLINTN